MARQQSPEKQPPHTYECVSCGARTTAEVQPVACPDCGSRMQNLSKPRE